MRRGAGPDPQDGRLEALGREGRAHRRAADREARGVIEKKEGERKEIWEEEIERERRVYGFFFSSFLFLFFLFISMRSTPDSNPGLGRESARHCYHYTKEKRI